MLTLTNTYVRFLQNYPNFFDKKNLDLFFQKVLVERDSQLSGYYDLPFAKNEAIFSYLKRNKAFLDSISNVVIVGIGGSSLGTKAIDALLSHQNNRKKIKLRFLEHTDPIIIRKDLQRIKYEDTLFIVISKSGLTIETTSLFKYILARFSLLKPERKKHLLTITDEGSPLFKWSQEERIESVTIKPNIGGRFSVLSAVGLLPLAILGYDIGAILKGASIISNRFFKERKDNVLKKALFLARNENNFPINVLFSYSSVFRHFNAWYVQLWGESLGKLDMYEQKRGLTPIALIGSIDQHSFLQLIMQGPANKTVTFLSVKNLSQKPLYIPNVKLKGLESTDFVNQTSFNQLLKLQCISTKESIISQNVPVDSIVLDSLNEQNVGALVLYYELLTSCVGILLQIDTYNQPGVEFGKKILREKFTHS
ncbi:glucose-6-phosphate isomerase [Helicobacter sp. MIT 05-5294]|uniref:glucose-6-phosphate isomerase n=1 Tax=Helicobacter sp. MIT 05-5294 TaxID=1548150 RepID=UPI00051FB8F1|nr:glucose-6-phosphate isomerase [Helicobacter sp. MIT 05-5294]TLD89107.1 glucose-6-phosphate isomerase [Helicobacter sp. MIT 05-5294]